MATYNIEVFPSRLILLCYTKWCNVEELHSIETICGSMDATLCVLLDGMHVVDVLIDIDVREPVLCQMVQHCNSKFTLPLHVATCVDHASYRHILPCITSQCLNSLVLSVWDIVWALIALQMC